ncbi:MAG: cbb3-type cytochrome oxidase subunit 3 [Reyranella sp.]
MSLIQGQARYGRAVIKLLLEGANAMDFTIYHVILIVAFVAIVIWAYGRRRKARFDKDARIPFDEHKE